MIPAKLVQSGEVMDLRQIELQSTKGASEYETISFNYRRKTKSFSVYGYKNRSTPGEMLELISLDGPSAFDHINDIREHIKDALDGGYVPSVCNPDVDVCKDINMKMSFFGAEKNSLGAHMIREWLLNPNYKPATLKDLANLEVQVTFDPGQICPIW